MLDLIPSLTFTTGPFRDYPYYYKKHHYTLAEDISTFL